MKVRIGVLVGIGPEATVEFYSRLIVMLQKIGEIEYNKNYPQIIINSIPAPELLYDKITEQDIQPYLDGLKELDLFKPDFIIMICNTIHLFYDELRKEIQTPIIDLRKELKNYIEKRNLQTMLILGTPLTIQNTLYKSDKVNIIYPDKKELAILSKVIFLFNRGIKKSKQIEAVKKICQKYLDTGSKIVVLACTELALMLKDENMPKIDTLDIMVQATVNKFNILKRYNMNSW